MQDGGGGNIILYVALAEAQDLALDSSQPLYGSQNDDNIVKILCQPCHLALRRMLFSILCMKAYETDKKT